MKRATIPPQVNKKKSRLTISAGDKVDIIRSLLGFNHPALRAIDVTIAKKIMGWKNIRYEKSKYGDWVGLNPNKEKELVPFYSIREPLALEVASRITLNRFIRLREPVDHNFLDKHYVVAYDLFFKSKKHGKKFHQVASSAEDTRALAICKASLEMIDLLDALEMLPPEVMSQVKHACEAQPTGEKK
jgi:hypothetical protein